MKQLPVRQPSSYGYQFYSYPLAILENYEQTKPWIYTNFIQLAFDRDFRNSPVPFCFYLFDYALNPWLQVHRLSREVMAMTRVSINDFLIESLTHDYYIYLNADEFFIPSRPHYGVEHFSHDLLIYGYHSVREEFSILGYDNYQSYRSSTVSYALLQQAYRSLDHIPNDCQQVYLYKFNPDAEYAFDLELMIGLLEDYLFGRNTSERFGMLAQPWSRAYGMDCYPYLQQYLELYVKKEIGYDIRHLHILWEHKHMMVKRVEFMKDLGLLEDMPPQELEAFRQLERNALILRNLHMKHSISVNKELEVRMIRLLVEIETTERMMIEQLIVGLRRQSDARKAALLSFHL